MPIILLIETEDGKITELPLLNKIVIGRSSSSDFKIADGKMSGAHCSFSLNGKNQVVFTDLDSTNGSFLNNSIVKQTLVRVNDTIKVGDTLITIDEKKLNPTERLAIGTAKIQRADDKTLPESPKVKIAEPSKTQPATAPAKEATKEVPKKKTIVLNKDLKTKKSEQATPAWGSSETVIEQEETGHTQFLQLDNKKKS